MLAKLIEGEERGSRETATPFPVGSPNRRRARSTWTVESMAESRSKFEVRQWVSIELIEEKLSTANTMRVNAL
jgi:hypothetical protein